jgi:hypothetical protein
MNDVPYECIYCIKERKMQKEWHTANKLIPDPPDPDGRIKIRTINDGFGSTTLRLGE